MDVNFILDTDSETEWGMMMNIFSYFFLVHFGGNACLTLHALMMVVLMLPIEFAQGDVCF